MELKNNLIIEQADLSNPSYRGTTQTTIQNGPAGRGGYTASGTGRGAIDNPYTPADESTEGTSGREPSNGGINGSSAERGTRDDLNHTATNSSSTDTNDRGGHSNPPTDEDSNNSYPFDVTSLQGMIDQLAASLMGGHIDFGESAKQIGEFLRTYQEYFTKFPKVTDGDALNLAQSVYNTISGYMTSYLNLLYDRQNWVFQQEYNNPISQIKRFMEAGINPAFYFGSLGNSNAGELSDSQMQGGQLNAHIDPTSPVLRGFEKAGNIIGNLVGAGTNVANTLSNFNYNRAQIDNMKALRPAQLESLYSGAYASQQAGEFSKANIGYQKVLTDCATEQLQIAWCNLIQAWDIAQLNSDTQLQSARIGADATKYSADAAFASNELSNRVAGYKAVIDQYYEEVTELGWVEEGTGNIFTSEDEMYGNISGSVSNSAGGSLGFGIGKAQSDYTVSASGELGGSLKEGVTTTYNGKKYTSKQVTYGRIKDYQKFRRAIRAVDGLVKHGSNDPTFNHYMAKGMRVVDKQQRKTLGSVAADFAQWILGYGLQ